jgi:hypothetical protein
MLLKTKPSPSPAFDRATASSADAAQFKKGKCSQVRQASARCVATPMSEVFKTLAYFGGFASEGLSAAGN